MLRWLRRHLTKVVVFLATVVVVGCTTASPVTPEAASPSPSAQVPSYPQLNGEATVELVVRGAPIVIQVQGTDAPITAGNFVDLVQKGVYDGTLFHRVVRDPEPFVVQGGDPLTKDNTVPPTQFGTGSYVDPETGIPRFIPLEIKVEGSDTPVYHQTLTMAGMDTQVPVLRHTRGAVAMARSQSPDSASSQFYIALADLSFLDGNYAVFGYVTSGMETVDQIQQGDRIESMRVLTGLENLAN